MRLSDYLDTAASRYPDKEALIYGETRLSFSQAQQWVHAIASALVRDGRRAQGAHVAVYSSNNHVVPLLQLGINRADMVWVGVHDRNSVETNAQVIAGFDCSLVFYHSRFASEVSQLREALPDVVDWICIDDDTSPGSKISEWLAGCWREYPYIPNDRNALACILPTGGTTGPSKGAAHSHHSTEIQMLCLATAYGLETNVRLLSVSPLSHAAGQLAFALIPNGGTNVILKEFSAERVIEVIREERISHVFLPPTVLYSLMAHPGVANADFSSLTHVMVGAAPVAPEKFKEAVQLFGPIVYEGYAQSETLMPVLIKRPSDYLDQNGKICEEILRSAGKAAPFMRVEIVDDDGRPVPMGVVGEIAVRASQGMEGYYKRPQESAEVRRNGFHLTGDVGVMIDGGFITIVDRKRDMIVTGGFNVFPAEIEAVINERQAVLDCIVVGVPDGKWGEAVKAIIQLKAGCTGEELEFVDYCRRRLGPVKTPKSIEFWTDLPRSAVGKLLRREVRDRFWKNNWRSV